MAWAVECKAGVGVVHDCAASCARHVRHVGVGRIALVVECNVRRVRGDRGCAPASTRHVRHVGVGGIACADGRSKPI